MLRLKELAVGLLRTVIVLAVDRFQVRAESQQEFSPEPL